MMNLFTMKTPTQKLRKVNDWSFQSKQAQEDILSRKSERPTHPPLVFKISTLKFLSKGNANYYTQSFPSATSGL